MTTAQSYAALAAVALAAIAGGYLFLRGIGAALAFYDDARGR